MIAQQPQVIKLIKSSYTVQSQSLDSALYANRFYNDQLLGEVIAIAKHNHQISNKIEQYKNNSPKFLGSWWESNSGPQSMTVFLNKMQKMLNEQISLMSQAIRSYQQEKELTSLQLQKEMEQQQIFKQKKDQLQRQFTQLSNKNSQQQSELNSIIEERQKFYQTYKRLHYNKQILQLQHTIHSDHVSRIQAANRNCTFYQAQHKYFEKLKGFLKHSLQRKCQLQQFNEQSKRQLQKINFLLENLQAERRGNQIRKQSIVTKHMQVQKIKEGLLVSEQKRKQAQNKKAQLEKIYCEEQMQKLAIDYDKLQQKCDYLLGKTLNLAKMSIQKTKIRPLESIINRKNAQ